jgi:methylmalonyl-CoA mutase N-terminal domain/subunit
MYDRKDLERLRQELERWEQTSLPGGLARLPERRETFITTSSEPVERLYTPLDVDQMDYRQDAAR